MQKCNFDANATESYETQMGTECKRKCNKIQMQRIATETQQQYNEKDIAHSFPDLFWMSLP